MKSNFVHFSFRTWHLVATMIFPKNLLIREITTIIEKTFVLHGRNAAASIARTVIRHWAPGAVHGLDSRRQPRIRYDTRRYFNVRSKADTSRLNLPHGTDNWTVENRKTKNENKSIMLRSISKQPGECAESGTRFPTLREAAFAFWNMAHRRREILPEVFRYCRTVLKKRQHKF